MGERKKPTPFGKPPQSPSAASSAGPNVPEAVIRKLSDLLKSTDLAEIEMSLEGISIRVRAKESHTQAPLYYSSPTQHAAPSSAATGAAAKAPSVDAYAELHIVRSPF